MIALLLFPGVAVLAVWWIGRRDVSRDPRLTTLAVALLVLMPALLWLPKIRLFPADLGLPVAMTPPPALNRAVWVVWGCGCLVGWFRLALSAVGLGRWRRESELLERVASDVEIRMMSGLRGPVAAGVWRRMIFVPPAWLEWGAETREAVLLHELAHHRRRDPLVRWLAAFACTFHWFNPLAHWLRKRLTLQCEQACDRKVVDTGYRADVYAEILCRFASPATPEVAGLAMAEQSSLERRIRHLMTANRSRGGVLFAVLAGFILWGALLLALFGPKSGEGTTPSPAEVELRLDADPFPADEAK